MTDGVDVGPEPVDQQMHGNFGRRRPSPRQAPALHVSYDQIVRRHHPLAETGRSGEHARVIEPHRNIAIGRGRKVACVDPTPGHADFAAMGLLGFGVAGNDGRAEQVAHGSFELGVVDGVGVLESVGMIGRAVAAAEGESEEQSDWSDAGEPHRFAR